MNLANFSNLLRELSYCRRAGSDSRSSLLLFLQTLRFHAANKLKLAGFDKPFCVSLDIAKNYPVKLYLRPFCGDLFILYEVLSGECYYVPPQRLPPSEVRVIVDCGANIGITSLYLASRYPNATVFSIEPHPENFALLQRNATQEPRIVPIHAAVTGIPQPHVKITLGRKAWGNGITEAQDGFRVNAITLSGLTEKRCIEYVDLLKIDIEGAEADVFRNGEFLSKVRFGLIELHAPYDEKQFNADLTRFGHRLLRPGAESGLKMIGFENVLAPLGAAASTVSAGGA
ncbi:MAG TPA: FkbM family methyltransferase [Hyphomicrobiales bacterium]|nr:FkbM family methyltransferase [Hyphomicrobiales bacterium]